MDEQRFQAYVELVEALLGCPQGQEDLLLQANAELVDPGLVGVMGQYADWMEAEGDSNAGWLWQFAGELVEALGLAKGDISSESLGAAEVFLWEIVQLLVQTQGDTAQVYEFFRANLGRLDEALLVALPNVFADLIQQNDPSLIASVFGTFGNLIQQFPDGSRMLNLEMSIACYEQTLQVYIRVAFPKQWATTQNNLANTYRNRIRGEKADNLEQAIEFYNQALQVFTRDAFPEDWAMTQKNLANAYSNRIRGNLEENIEWAIKFYNQVLQEVRTKDALPEQWADTQNNLANAYSKRIAGERAENIEWAIKFYNQALQVFTRDAFPEDWAMTQNNLANAYSNRIKGDRAENIEQAIDAYKQVLTVRTQAAMPIEWAKTTNNLANAYSSYIKGDRAENIEQAIAAYEQALTEITQAVMPIEWATTTMNLANAYKNRIKGDLGENIEQAIVHYRDSLTIFEPARLPNDCRKAARSLAHLYSDHQRWSEAVSIYDQALEAAEILYQSATLLGSKATSLSETANLPRRAAYAFASTGDLPKAVFTLEQGRARGLSESLDRDRANLSELKSTHPSLYDQYQDITQQLRNIEAQQRSNSLTPEVLRATNTKLRSDLEAASAQIRQVPNYEDFLTPTKREDITIALRTDNPLIYIVTTPNGSVTIVVTPDNTEAIWSDFTEAQLQELVQDWFKAYNNSQTDRQTWYNTIESTTRDLWDLLMGPIVQHLKSKGFDRATLIPTGYLSLLPLHAAWTPDTTRPTGKRYALDDIHFTYTPNAKSLTEARAIAERPFANSILAIDNPRQDLPNSQREIDCAIESFGDRSTVLRHGEATIDAVKSGLSEAAIVHFSCHGTANFTEPLNSGLLMSDGLLTLKDLLALNLAQDSGIRLAILSACETGLPGLDNIDEVVSLPIGLLQAGVAGVISSLWSVSDLSTMLLLTKFYELWREQKLPPDQALRQAQIWLRDSTNAEKVIEFKNTIDQTRMPASTAQQLFDELAWETKNERSFNHPFHWAAFSYTGI